MPIYLQPLYGGCSDFCDRYWAICGRAPRKRRKRTVTVKPVAAKSLQKPAHLKYVRYHPNAVVSAAWRGVPEPVPVLRSPPFSAVASAVDAGNVRAVVPVGVNSDLATVLAVPGRRKRKASD